MDKKIGILSLGCARNLVDSEIIAGNLKRKGYQIVDLDSMGNTVSNGADNVDVALVNTCAFIKEAKQESIQTILDLIELKNQGRLKKIIVSGCLSQRYSKKLIKDLPEIDAFSGVISLNHTQERFPFTPAHYAYVKICEGCINSCSFCVIPKIKQGFTSRKIKSIIQEVKSLQGGSCAEINLIGQDITAYGWDLYGESRLVDLIRQILENIERINPAPARRGGINWLRLLYLAPERLSEELIKLIASQPRIVKYIDLPLQHINNRILKLMKRNLNSSQIYKLIDNIRKRIPDVALRTSLIVGFPTETEEDFGELVDFVQKAQFERLGLFMYSREEGTQAYGFNGQIPQRIKQERYNRIMSCQQEIARQVNQRWQGKTVEVLIEQKQEDVHLRPQQEDYGRTSSDYPPKPYRRSKNPKAKADGLYIGRSQYDAPEVDGLVYVKTQRDLSIGGFTDVKIIDTLEYDLVGQVE